MYDLAISMPKRRCPMPAFSGHVTLVKDATAAFSREAMTVAHEINGPTFAHAILTTDELIAAIDHARFEARPSW